MTKSSVNAKGIAAPAERIDRTLADYGRRHSRILPLALDL